jgi:hypothetical protein
MMNKVSRLFLLKKVACFRAPDGEMISLVEKNQVTESDDEEK